MFVQVTHARGVACVIAATIILLFTSCSKEPAVEEKPSIDDFAGSWESLPMSQLFEAGIDEQIEDLQKGTHPEADQFDKFIKEEIRSLSNEEAKKVLRELGYFEVPASLFEQGDPIMGFTISPPSRFAVYVRANGERQTTEFDAEYELTSKEIICRYDDGPSIFTISGDQLIIANEKEGYPTKFKLRRVPGIR